MRPCRGWCGGGRGCRTPRCTRSSMTDHVLDAARCRGASRTPRSQSADAVAPARRIMKGGVARPGELPAFGRVAAPVEEPRQSPHSTAPPPPRSSHTSPNTRQTPPPRSASRPGPRTTPAAGQDAADPAGHPTPTRGSKTTIALALRARSERLEVLRADDRCGREGGQGSVWSLPRP